MPWLDAGELRIGLGCMRLEEHGAETLAAAVAAGITVFDTARAYDGSEELLGRTLATVPEARVVTKGGMSRPNGAWVPDGRARSIRADCEASLAALNGVPIDLYLLHTPDPRTPWTRSVRALARLVEEGLVARVGVCNVSRAQLDEALELVPIAAVQVALSVFDDHALRGGVLDRCIEAEVTLIAHSPLGGPRRRRGLARHEALVEIARAHGVTEAEVALAWILGLADDLVVIPGARRPEAVAASVRAASLTLSGSERARIDRPRPTPSRSSRDGDVVIVMGVPGAGKSRLATELTARGYLRLNRDERGGTLRGLAEELRAALASAAQNVVLDNTYLTRAGRNDIVEAAAAHGLSARCIWLDTPLAQAQINLVERLLDRFDGLPSPEELKAAARSKPGLLTPTQQMRAFRDLEAPSDDEGFASIERIAFEREPAEGRSAVFVAAAAVHLLPADVTPGTPCLVFDWSAEIEAEAVAAATARVRGPVATAVCPHPGGPPICWCRPPLPGLPLAFARRHGVDPARSVLVGASPAHRTLANALGARYVGA
jgi:aryl-alcohol dehydrogenase-like predicted oxidoreductase/predicted kinase